jgi:hypothetical protein
MYVIKDFDLFYLHASIYLLIDHKRRVLSFEASNSQSLFVAQAYKSTIGQFTAMPTEPYGALAGPVIHPFSTNPRI